MMVATPADWEFLLLVNTVWAGTARVTDAVSPGRRWVSCSIQMSYDLDMVAMLVRAHAARFLPSMDWE